MTTNTPLRSVRSSRTVGNSRTVLTEQQVRTFVHEALDAADLDGRSVCLLVPDATRSCPLPLLVDEVHRCLAGRVSKLTLLVALGTHAEMGERDLARHLGYQPGRLAARYPGLEVRNHAWWDPEAFAHLGSIDTHRVEQLSGGLLSRAVDVRLNKAVAEHDVALVVGPVFPHEVVGFSGGNKYFFPGAGGQEVIDVSHWLGALITNAELIGSKGTTPVRALIDEAAALIPAEKLALCVVLRPGTDDLHAVTFGDTESAWASAAEVSASAHVRYIDAPVKRAVSLMPEKYTDMWTAAKGFYKVEPVVADGGEVIVYAPHVTEFSATHPEIADIGYHCRDFFLHDWDRFEHLPWSVLAHSTHLRGAGSYDERCGERLRVDVTLATGIPEHAVRAANLGYRDPTEVDLAAYRGDPETLVIPDAGETLFRLR